MSLHDYIEALESYAKALETGYNTGDLPENIVQITEAVTLAKETLIRRAALINFSQQQVERIRDNANDEAIKDLCSDWLLLADRLDRVGLVCEMNAISADHRLSWIKIIKYLLDTESSPVIGLFLEGILKGTQPINEKEIEQTRLFLRLLRKAPDTYTGLDNEI